MLPQAKIEEIRRLLAEGKSQRRVAQLAYVSRGTVGAVASGQCRDRVELPSVDDVPTGPSVRCPGCGGRVYAPCLLCRVRRLQTEERADRRRTAGRILRTPADVRRRDDPTFGG
jgi:hypothetical protein